MTDKQKTGVDEALELLRSFVIDLAHERTGVRLADLLDAHQNEPRPDTSFDAYTYNMARKAEKAISEAMLAATKAIHALAERRTDGISDGE